MSNSFQLLRLQQKDSQMDDARKRIAEIDFLINHDLEIVSINEKLQSVFSKISLLQKEIDKATAEIKEKQIRIEQSSSALYSGSIKNPKELEDVQNEVNAHTRAIEKKENDLLLLLCDLEFLETQKSDLTHSLGECQKRINSQNSLLYAEKNKLIALLEKYETERTATTSQIESSEMQIYMSLRERKNGIAITTLTDDSCSACGFVLTPAQCQQAKSSAVYFYCPGCGRIIYAV